MQQSKLIQILKTLNKEEFLQFRKVLQSPFFVGNDKTLKLYDSIRHYYPAFTSAKLSKEKVFQKVFPAYSYDDNRMRNLMRRFTQQLKDYLIWISLKDDKRDYQKRLIKVYANRQLFGLYQKERNAFLQRAEALPFRGIDYYQDLFELHHDYYYYPQRQKNNQNDSTLAHLVDAIDKRFMLSKLRIGIEVRNQGRIFKKKYALAFLDAVLNESVHHSDNLVLQLFARLFKVYSDVDEEAFAQLEAIFFPNIRQFDLQDAQLIYYYALNYINRKVNEGLSEASSSALAWYKSGLQEGLLEQNGKISEVSFGNIVTHGCRQRDFAWTKKFIESYGAKVHSKHVEDNVQFNWGLWHFYRGNLEESFSLLSKYHFHHSFQLKVRLTALRVLFEQFIHDSSYYDAVISYAKAFQKFLQRESLYSEAISAPLKQTVKIIKALATKIRNQERKESIKAWFEKKMAAKQNMVVKIWLQEKVNDL